MSTENRSSNTEQMVSVPRDEVERLVKLLQYQAHPYPSPHAAFWQGLLDAPAAQHQAGGYSAGDMADQGAKAFRDGQRALPLPERRQWNGLGNAADNLKASGWNACLDEVRRLNTASISPE